MVLEAPNQMSGVKKVGLRMSMKLSLSRKTSSKKSANRTSNENSDVIASPIPENDFGECQDKTRSGAEIDIKSTSNSKKSPSVKSHRWKFRTKRADSDGSVKYEPKGTPDLTCLKEEEECVQPGSNLSEKHKDTTSGVSGDPGDDPAGGDHRKCPSHDNDSQHQFHYKVGGYVTPVRRDEHLKNCEQLLEIKLKHVKGIDCSDVSNGSSTGAINSNQHSSLQQLDNDARIAKVDTFQQNLYERPLMPPPPPVDHSNTGPPKIPPKPASLRCRSLPTPGQGAADEVNADLDSSEIPPRPPARPKNRSLGTVVNRPWQSGKVVCVDNRATVYEIVSAVPKESSLAEELAKLPRQPWYWGPLTQVQAEEKLAKLPDGNFLVRDSSDERYLLSLSFNSHGRTLHTRIEHRNGLFSLNDSDGHTSIVELIDCAVKESRSGVYGYMRDALGVQSFPARLTDWVSRFTEMRSLQHLCRFLIREVYPRHHIQMLPLPKKIKEYILENQY